MPFIFDLPVFHFATEGAEAATVQCLFDKTPTEIISLMRKRRFQGPPVAWTYFEDEEDGQAWTAENITGGDTRGINNPLPCSVEAHLIGDKLLSQSGREVVLFSYIIPFSGGYYLFGEFVMEPEVSLSPGKGRWAPVEVSEQIRAGTMRGQIMSGFAMDSDGIWHPHTWVVAPDGKVIETEGPHSHFYGVRLSEQGTRDFLELNKDDRE